MHGQEGLVLNKWHSQNYSQLECEYREYGYVKPGFPIFSFIFVCEYC